MDRITIRDINSRLQEKPNMGMYLNQIPQEERVNLVVEVVAKHEVFARWVKVVRVSHEVPYDYNEAREEIMPTIQKEFEKVVDVKSLTSSGFSEKELESAKQKLGMKAADSALPPSYVGA